MVDLISLTYLSLATSPLDEDQLKDLLAESRDNNARSDVTGMLLYADQQFIQTIEGRRHDVEATMERILADPRHHHVDITLVDDIESRSFPEWTMGFKVLTQETADEMRGFTDFLDPESERYRQSEELGRAGVFLRAFRDVIPEP